MSTNSILSKDEVIKKELSLFKKIFADIPKDKKSFAEKLYSQAAFMSATLAELQKIINSEGAVIEGTNGNGFITYSEHPAQKSYNTMIKNYNATIKALIDLLPEAETEDDELVKFIKGAK